MSSGRNQANVLALRTAGIYLIIGLLWIVLSDWAVRAISNNLQTISRLQTLKGWFFVSASFWLLYFIVKQHISTLLDSQEASLRSNRALQTLSAANAALLQSADESDLLNRICRIVVETGGYRMAWVGYSEQDEARTVRPVAQAGFDEEYLQAAHISWADTERGRGPTGRAIRTGKPVLACNIPTDPAYAPWREAAIKRGYASSVAIPIITGDLTLGALNIYSTEVNAFGAEELRLLEELAGNLAYGIQALKNHIARAEAEQSLRNAETKYRDLYDFAPDMCASMDAATGKITECNYRTAEALGYAKDEIIGQHILDLYAPDSRRDAQEAFELFLETGELRDAEFRLQRKDGSKLNVSLNVSAIRDADGKIIRSRAIWRDITERKAAQKALKESEKKYRQLFENMSQGFVLCEAVHDEQGQPCDFRILEMNPASVRLTGMTSAYLMGRYMREVGGEPVWIERFARVTLTGIPEHFEGYSGTVNKWFEVFAYRPRPEQCAIAFTEITKRKLVEQALKQSQERFHRALDNIPDVITIYDPDLRIRYINSATQRITGRKKSEFIGKRDEEMWPPEIYEAYLPTLRDAFKTGTIRATETEISLPNEGRRSLSIVCVPLIDESGKVREVMGITHNFTERKRAEEALMETQNLLNDVGRIAKIGGWRMDLLTRKATWTLATYDIAEMAPRTSPPGPDEHLNFYLPEYRPMVAEAMRALIEENRPLDFEAQLRTAKGNIKWCHAIGKAIRRCGKAIAVYGTFQDITKRKEAEKTLRQSATKRQELEFIIGRSPAVAFLWRATEGWPVEYVSENVRQFGYTPEDFHSGRIQFPSIVHPDDLQRLTNDVAVRARRVNSVQFSQEYRLISPSGRVHWVDDRTWVRRNDKGEITHYQGILLDITERKQTEEALQNSEKRFRSIFEGASEGILVADAESRTFRYANPSICQMLGYTTEELLRMTIADIHPPEDLSAVLKTFEAQAKGDIRLGTDMPCLHKDGSVFHADINTAQVEIEGRPCLAGFFSDTTERRLLETQLRQAQKMEAVGQLAGGVAHDFNNMLTGIKGYVSFCLETAEKESQLYDDLVKASALADRAADLTRQLLAFGRRQTLEPVVLDLNHLIEEQIAMERRILGENVDIRFLPSANLGKVRADPGQIEQVLMNLVINSRDAMPKGGRLTIETANVELSKRYAEEHAGVKPGPYVMFAVSDNGCGIDKAQQERIFDPFFTTKEQGKGTGLGLATVYGIVKQHGGNIWVYSEPGKGATFKVYLPRVVGKVEKITVQKPAVQGGTETVLLVEDEKAVRDIARRFLEGFGYTVLCASCGNEAKDIAGRSGPKIALLLTDIVMPDMNGRELYEHLSKKHPHMKALYMSGYTDNAVVQDGALDEGMPFLQKPFDPDKLARKVREVLDKPAE